MSALGQCSASPAMPPVDETGRTAVGYPHPEPGLTIRQRFAMTAMQGILANPVYEAPRRTKLGGMAEDAVRAADALLAELAKDGAK